ncbi:MAG TPA: hypothetical protein VEH05_00800 [Streptosporangiaceae bacterium]|nr:hypothetical protein [Streptosporangiaceae bacterium]
MTERYSEPPPRGRRITTGEFRATPDISASTAQFKAFAAGQGEQTGQWDLEAAPARSRTRLAVLILAVVVVVAIIAILAVTLS